MATSTGRLAAVLTGACLGALVTMGVFLSREATQREDHQGELAELRFRLADSQRSERDYRAVAEAERERRRVVEEDAERLRAIVNAPGTAGGGGTAGDSGAGDPVDVAPVPAVTPPSDWDMPRVRLELQRLARLGRRMSRSRLVGAVAEACGVHGEPALRLLHDILAEPGLGEGLHNAAALVIERLHDGTAVPLLRARLARLAASEGDDADAFLSRRLTMRVLATLPGHGQVPDLLSVWNSAENDPRLRLFAIHGLARRGHAEGVAVVRGESSLSTPPLRARAIESLHSFASAGDYERTDLIDVFGTALGTADGDGQTRLALLALEGYWRAECVPHLDAYARAHEGAPLADRAAGIAERIRAGEARPERAGQPLEGDSAPRTSPPAGDDDG